MVYHNWNSNWSNLYIYNFWNIKDWNTIIGFLCLVMGNAIYFHSSNN